MTTLFCEECMEMVEVGEEEGELQHSCGSPWCPYQDNDIALDDEEGYRPLNFD